MKKISIFVVFLFCILSFATFSGAKSNSDVNLIVKLDGKVIIEQTFQENENERTVAEKLFYFKRHKIVDKFKDDGLGNSEIIAIMFPEMAEKLEKLSAEYYKEDVNASVKFTPNNVEKFSYLSEKLGQKLALDEIYAEIIRQIDSRRIEVVAKLEYKFPKITEQQLHLNTVLRSSFKTYYGYSAPARKSNIGRALSQINGTVLENKQEFSFNNIVGARSRSRGYVEAPIIINGSFVSGVGGGVCQVSTTIYNAALLADLEVKNVAKHSLPVKYAPPSFDAMVSSVTDFKFINNTGEKIYICATCDGNYINISIYGKPLDCEIRLESIKVRDIPFKTDYIDNINAELGVEKVLSSGISGIESKGYIVKSIGSKVVSTKLIRHDIYAPQARLVSIGTKITADINENTKQNDFEISQAENQ